MRLCFRNYGFWSLLFRGALQLNAEGRQCSPSSSVSLGTYPQCQAKLLVLYIKLYLFLVIFSMKKHLKLLFNSPPRFRNTLIAYYFTVNILNLFSSHIENFTRFFSLWFYLFSKLSTPGKKNAFPNSSIFIFTRHL